MFENAKNEKNNVKSRFSGGAYFMTSQNYEIVTGE